MQTAGSVAENGCFLSGRPPTARSIRQTRVLSSGLLVVLHGVVVTVVVARDWSSDRRGCCRGGSRSGGCGPVGAGHLDMEIELSVPCDLEVGW
jgi:hypothetical protein